MSCSNEFFQVGHTHNLVDQRFSIINPALKRTKCLETPDDFLDLILSSITPTGNREIHVEKIDAVHNWADWFGEIEATLSGITITQREHDVTHSWRVVRRSDLPLYKLKYGSTDSVRIELPLQDCA